MIKIHNQKSMLLVDGKYKNLAFLEKKRLTAYTYLYYSRADFNYPNGVPVIALDDRKTVGMYSCVSDGATITVSGANNSTAECYLFGYPSFSSPTGKAGLKIYSELDGQLVFDSRLSYLNIIGVCQPNMTIDTSKKLGVLFANPTYVIGYRGDTGYVNDYEVDTAFFWEKRGDKLLYKRCSVTNGLAIMSSYDSRHGMPPFLVDLTGL